MESDQRPCDPTWNHLARWVLLYVLPLALLGLALRRGAIELDVDFFVPFLWGLLVPAWNTRERAGRPWAFKDFQARDCYPPTVALLHAVVWSLALALTRTTWQASVVFGTGFFLYDGLLLRYRLLCIYALPLAVQRRGTLATLFTYGVVWWGYLAAGLGAVHVATRSWEGSKTLAIVLSTVGLIAPAQAVLLLWRRVLAPPQRLRAIRRVAVIGAGWNGLYATKWLRDYGLEVTCFDARDALGGLWRFDAVRSGGVFESTCATSSKHFLHASDLRFEEGGDFPNHQEIVRFLERYAEHFHLHPLLRLGTRVDSAEHSAPGGWRLLVRSARGSEELRFDALVVASGPQGTPSLDPLYGVFEGALSHAADYKNAADVRRDEQVLVVGAGESAADIVAECVRAGARVHWSAPHGQWFADRHVGPYAADHFTAVGIRALLGRFLNVEYLVRRLIIAAFIRVAWGRGGHGVRGWEPCAPYLHQYLNKSRDAIREVHWGRVTPHGPALAVDAHTVLFADGRTRFDRILLATGYRPSWPFLAAPPKHLYKLVFDPDDPTLAFVGFARPVLGSIPSLGEVQARWVASVFSGRRTLPAPWQRHVRIYHDLADHALRYQDNGSLGNLVDQETYSDEIARYGGFALRWLRLVLRPRTLWAVLRSPWIAFKLRINDPDREERTRAYERIVSELPDAGHPLTLLVALLAAVPVLLVGLLALAFWSLPTAPLCLGLAAALVGGALALRWSEPWRLARSQSAWHAARDGDERGSLADSRDTSDPAEDGYREGVSVRRGEGGAPERDGLRSRVLVAPATARPAGAPTASPKKG